VVRMAALYDIHGNLPALEAVLRDVRDADVDQIIVGGDVIPGPMPRETLECLLDLDIPLQFIRGNGEMAVLAQIAAGASGPVKYWGTASGAPPPAVVQDVLRWSATQLPPELVREVGRWPETVRLSIDGAGDVLICHGTPRSEAECFTRETPEALLLPVFEGADADLVVCGHTHMQFDRLIGDVRVVNAGSVGMPFGVTGADWLLLGPVVQLRHTTYDLDHGAARVRATSYPGANDFAARHILDAPSEAAMLAAFTHISFGVR